MYKTLLLTFYLATLILIPNDRMSTDIVKKPEQIYDA